jgi:hypothetical protein
VATVTPDDADQREARPYWKLAEDDKRGLFITIVGGLAANVGLVLVLALGLLIDHQLRRNGVSFGTLFLTTALITFGAAVLAVLVLIVRSRRRGKPGARLARALLNFLTGVYLLATAIFLLAVVGYAAGVK